MLGQSPILGIQEENSEEGEASSDKKPIWETEIEEVVRMKSEDKKSSPKEVKTEEVSKMKPG